MTTGQQQMVYEKRLKKRGCSVKRQAEEVGHGKSFQCRKKSTLCHETTVNR